MGYELRGVQVFILVLFKEIKMILNLNNESQYIC